MRPATRLQSFFGRTPISPDDWAALMHIREQLPGDAVILSRNDHKVDICFFSGIAGRRTFLEYEFSIAYLTGTGQDRNEGRKTRIDRVWNASTPAEFMAAVEDTGCTHLVEYAQHPLVLKSYECLEPWWTSPTGEVTIWAVRAPRAPSTTESLARRPLDEF